MKVGIFGAGWLGKPLALFLQDRGFDVRVTARSEEGKAMLEQLGMNAFSVKVNDGDVTGELDFFDDLTLLIISLPPVATACFKQLLRYLKSTGLKQTILFSSTGIYADCEGKVIEESALNLHLSKVMHLKEIEDLFLTCPYLNTTVLRLGGLWGADRHPVHFLARKDILENADEPVNLVEQKTVCEVVFNIMSRVVTSTVFNVVDDDHRSREAFYSEAAFERNLVLPPFRKSLRPLNRIVSNDKLKDFLK